VKLRLLLFQHLESLLGNHFLGLPRWDRLSRQFSALRCGFQCLVV
jgi:hypothetical protein